MAKPTSELEQLRQKDLTVLNRELQECNLKLQRSTVDLAFGRLPKTSQIRLLRRQIARLKTVLKEKEMTHA